MPQTTWRPMPAMAEPSPRRSPGHPIAASQRAKVVAQVLEMRAGGMKLQDIADRLGIGLSTASRIAKGRA